MSEEVQHQEIEINSETVQENNLSTPKKEELLAEYKMLREKMHAIEMKEKLQSRILELQEADIVDEETLLFVIDKLGQEE